MCQMPLSWRSILGGTRLPHDISLSREAPATIEARPSDSAAA
jgi:hypothetical protein